MITNTGFSSIEELAKWKARKINKINIKFYAKYITVVKSFDLKIDKSLEEFSDNLKLIDEIGEEKRKNLEDLNKRYLVYKAKFTDGVLNDEKYYEYYTAKYNLHYVTITNSLESANKKQRL